ncbi:hypothetical protein [Kitasatospora cinereorecta]|uniref:Uncharacterized protein n=1 Tax=Kitasatospora cinereorecta TaxID=285560 RepID=A0ABW0V3S4_9ACTN
MRRRTVIGLGAGAGIGFGLLGLGRLLSPAADAASPKPPLRTETAPLERRFPQLGPLSDAKWLIDSDADDARSLPSPDHELAGFVRVRPGLLAELRATFAFAPEQPPTFSSWWEGPLAEAAPKDVRWVRSEAFDASGTNHGWFLFDPGSDLVFFRAVNPQVVVGPSVAPQPGGSASG